MSSQQKKKTENNKFQKSYFDVLGLCCPSEVPLIENILNSLDGVKEFSVIVPSRTVIVVHDALLISQLQIVKALNQARLEANVRAYGEKSYKKKWPSPWAVASGMLLAVSFLKYVYGPFRWLALGAVAAGLFPILSRAFASIRNFRLDINILVLIAVIGTIAMNDYTEAGTIVFLFTIAEWLESRASHKASAVMSSLMSLAPQKAVLSETGEEVDADEVKLNTILAVKAGEVIPIDGVVVDGKCEVDEKTLTGESFPVPKEKDSTVWAGTINLNGYISLKTAALAEDCVVAKMTKLVEEAQNSKSKTQRFIDKCSQYYTPAVVIISACLAVIPAALRVRDLNHWFHLALVVLVSACPCGLILSTPVATFCALTKAATSGLLIKGGDYLEILAKIKVTAFDKTGTITMGEFVVTDFQSLHEDFSVNTLLYWVSSIESKSSHPLAAALVNYAKALLVKPKPESVEDYQNFPGEGLHGNQNLADTLCGSPLYMAPEIIQNQKYDAKADLWSVGAILFQLVTGKLPFDGNNQYQLFQNILRCTQLQFPEGALEELHPDCVDLCRGLLCQNPVERLSFEEFFNHKFLQEPRQTMDVEQTSAPSELQLMAEQPVPFTSQGRPPLQSRHSMSSGSRNSKSSSSSIHENIVSHNHGAASSSKGFHGFMPTIAYDKIRKSVVAHCSTDQLGGVESVESIEKDYVLVDPLFASAETLSYLEASLQDIHTSILCNCPSKKIDQGSAIATGIKKITASSSDVEIPSGQQAKSSGSTFLGEVQGLTILHPSGRLYILNQYVQVLEELAQEQYKAGQCLESFSVELLVLAIWKKALQICNSWMISIKEGESPATSSAKESAINRQDPGLALYSEQRIDFHTPLSVRTWAEQGFIFAFDCAEKLSDHLRNMDANAEMPDAMEIIYRHALALGTNGAVHEYMDNKGSAAASYSKAALLLSFLVGEATTLPLNPPFLLTPDNKKRIQNYIFSLQSRQAHFLMSQTDPKQSPNSHIK